MATRDILNNLGEVIGTLSLPDETTEEAWQLALAPYAAAPVQPTMNEIIDAKIADAEAYGKELMKRFTRENVIMGITQSGKTEAVTDYLHKLSHYILTGSLYAALNEVARILADTSQTKADLEPFITNERMLEYEADIKRYLGVE